MSDTPIEEIQEEPAAALAADATIEEADATIEGDPEEGVSEEDEQDEDEQDEEEAA